MFLSRAFPFFGKLGKFSFCCPAIQIKLESIHHLGLFSLSAVPLPLSSKPWVGWEGDSAAAEEGRTASWSDTHQPFSPVVRWNPAARFCYRRQFGFCWSDLMGDSWLPMRYAVQGGKSMPWALRQFPRVWAKGRSGLHCHLRFTSSLVVQRAWHGEIYITLRQNPALN